MLRRIGSGTINAFMPQPPVVAQEYYSHREQGYQQQRQLKLKLPERGRRLRYAKSTPVFYSAALLSEARQSAT